MINLGIKNDEQHIIWDKNNRSITIYKDENKNSGEEPVKIFIKIDSAAGYVNGIMITLDSPAILYKDKTYIPARFIAQSLGKEVAWDGKTSTVLIQDKAESGKIKNILEKTVAAMDVVKKARYIYEDTTSVTDGRDKSSQKSIGSGEVDIEKKVAHLIFNVQSTGQSTDTYFANGAIYVKSSGFDQWIKNDIAKEQFETIFNKNNLFLLQKDELLYAGINAAETNDGIALKGDILDWRFAKTLGIVDESKKLNVEILLEKGTYRLSKIVAEIGSEDALENAFVKQNRTITMLFMDYDGAYEVLLPEEVEKSAVLVN
ncbi:MAG: copper amine oxidase family protein [Clostridiales bacterium]|nr:copper amine oxidase family protein [Clostridiales bacterium]